MAGEVVSGLVVSDNGYSDAEYPAVAPECRVEGDNAASGEERAWRWLRTYREGRDEHRAPCDRCGAPARDVWEHQCTDAAALRLPGARVYRTIGTQVRCDGCPPGVGPDLEVGIRASRRADTGAGRGARGMGAGGDPGAPGAELSGGVPGDDPGAGPSGGAGEGAAGGSGRVVARLVAQEAGNGVAAAVSNRTLDALTQRRRARKLLVRRGEARLCRGCRLASGAVADREAMGPCEACDGLPGVAWCSIDRAADVASVLEVKRAVECLSAAAEAAAVSAESLYGVALEDASSAGWEVRAGILMGRLFALQARLDDALTVAACELGLALPEGVR